MTSLTFKVLDSSDWPEVQLLMASSPMSAAMPLIIQRPQLNFADAYPQLGGKNIIFGCYDGTNLVGYFRFMVADFTGSNVYRKTCYVSDVRVAPGYRGHGILNRFLEMQIDYAISINCGSSFAFSNSGNNALDRSLSKMESITTQIPTSFKTKSFFLHGVYPALKLNSLVKIERPKLNNVPAMSQEYDFNQIVTAEEWDSFLMNYPEIQFYGLKENPDVVVFALWKTSKLRRYSMCSYPFALRLFQKLWNQTVGRFKAQIIPSQNEEWGMVDICFVHPELIFKDDWLHFCKIESASMGALMLNFVFEIGGKGTVETRKFERSLGMTIKTDLKYFTIPTKISQTDTLHKCSPSINLSLM